KPRAVCRKRTVKLIVAVCPTTRSAALHEIRHVAGSRSGLEVTGCGSRWDASRNRTAEHTAQTPQPAPRAKNAQPPPDDAASGGRASAETSPPTGTFACRIPRARPRSERGNHCITARPLAALTLAPNAPAATSKRMKMRELFTNPDAASAAA